MIYRLSVMVLAIFACVMRMAIGPMWLAVVWFLTAVGFGHAAWRLRGERQAG